MEDLPKQEGGGRIAPPPTPEKGMTSSEQCPKQLFFPDT